MDSEYLTVLCVGNRLVVPDDAACRLYDAAQAHHWPDKVRWVDGGLGGMNLLPWFEDSQAVLVVDYMPDQPHGRLIADLSPYLDVTHYDHDSALRYLLKQLPVLLDAPPEVAAMSCTEVDQPGVFHAFEQVKHWINAV